MTLKSDQNSDPDQSVGRLPQFMPFSRGHSDISNRGDNCSYHQPTITSDLKKKGWIFAFFSLEKILLCQPYGPGLFTNWHTRFEILTLALGKTWFQHFFRLASLAPTPARPSVSKWYFQISILSASLNPYKELRWHCGNHDNLAVEVDIIANTILTRFQPNFTISTKFHNFDQIS